MTDNKIWFLLGGLLVGYWIAKNRTEKIMKSNAEAMAAKAVNEASKLFDSMLQQAEKQGLTITQVRNELAKPA